MSIRRSAETAAILVVGLLFPASLLLFVILLLFSRSIPFLNWFYLREVALLYLFWILIIDRRKPFRGGRPNHWVRSLPVWDYVRDYFPAELHIVTETERKKPLSNNKTEAKAAALVTSTAEGTQQQGSQAAKEFSTEKQNTKFSTSSDPTEPLTDKTDASPVQGYPHPILSNSLFPPISRADNFDPKYAHIFACHPHGIISVASIVNLVLNCNQASNRIGIPYRFLTVSANFILPFWRDLVLACGFISASPASAAWCLRKGISIFIVVGGALEALDARPGSNDLTLARRKGFIRLSLQYGARLVPVYHFGENELYDQYANPPGSLLRRIQITLIRWVGFTLPLFQGRGIFNNKYGFLPHRVALHTVIGKPILIPHVPNPSSELIDYYHNQYIDALKQLYEEYCNRYTPTCINGENYSLQPQPLRIVG